MSDFPVNLKTIQQEPNCAEAVTEMISFARQCFPLSLRVVFQIDFTVQHSPPNRGFKWELWDQNANADNYVVMSRGRAVTDPNLTLPSDLNLPFASRGTGPAGAPRGPREALTDEPRLRDVKALATAGAGVRKFKPHRCRFSKAVADRPVFLK